MPEFFFQRYVNGERMADDVLITKQATLEDAIPAALRLCWNSPKSVLVYIPQTPWRDIKSAPRDKKVLVLGKMEDGTFYQEVCKYFSVGGCWPIVFMHGYLAPTQWMPLPEPPQQSGDIK